ncbi:MAG TPA: hypothetical protein VGI58_09685 [Streptosporangiaceae bacterium]
MTRSAPRRTSTLQAVLLTAVGLLLTGCAGAAAQVRLPAKPSGTPAAAAAAAASRSPRQQVLTAYTGYTTATTQAFASKSAPRVRQLLDPFLAPATVGNFISAFRQDWVLNEVAYGQPVRHILGVRVQGGAAWVHECDDTTQSGLAYAGTGQVVPGSLGVPDFNLVTRLNLIRGRWMIGVQTVEDVPCRP